MKDDDFKLLRGFADRCALILLKFYFLLDERGAKFSDETPLFSTLVSVLSLVSCFSLIFCLSVASKRQ